MILLVPELSRGVAKECRPYLVTNGQRTLWRFRSMPYDCLRIAVYVGSIAKMSISYGKRDIINSFTDLS